MGLEATSTEYSELAAAIKAGITEVSYANGNKVKYASLDQMRSVLAEMSAEINGSASAPRFSRVGFSRD